MPYQVSDEDQEERCDDCEELISECSCCGDCGNYECTCDRCGECGQLENNCECEDEDLDKKDPIFSKPIIDNDYVNLVKFSAIKRTFNL